MSIRVTEELKQAHAEALERVRAGAKEVTVFQDPVRGGRLFLRGATFWLDLGVDGRRFKESARTKELRPALAKLDRRLSSKTAGTFVGPSEERVTLARLAELMRDDYRAEGRKTLGRLNAAWGHVFDYFGEDYRALNLTDARVKTYRVHRLDEGAAEATIQQEVAAIKRGLRLAARARLVAAVPEISGINISDRNARQGFFTEGDVAALVLELPGHLRPVVRFAFYTGWRKGEILGLTWAAVDFEDGVVRLAATSTKNRKPREMPFTELPALRLLLEEQRDAAERIRQARGGTVSHVFHHPDGRQIRMMDKSWRSACKRAGLSGWLFHDFRRSAVRNLERAGVPRSVAMSFTGHRTEHIYVRYAIVDKAAQRDGLKKLAMTLASTT